MEPDGPTSRTGSLFALLVSIPEPIAEPRFAVPNSAAGAASQIVISRASPTPTRVPIGEAEQMVARLRALGREVEFLRLEDEGHQIAKLKNKLVAYPQAVEFLSRHLLGEGPHLAED